MPDQSFPKTERLCSHNLISSLFEDGNSFHINGYKVVWKVRESASSPPVEVAFAVPKKSFKKAVQRNLIRRRLKEAYRKAKSPLFDSLSAKPIAIAVMVIYLGKELPGYSSVQQSIDEIVAVLIRKTNK